MKKKERTRRISTVAAIMIRIGIILLALWLFSMSYLTLIVAQDLQRQWKEGSLDFRDHDGFVCEHTESVERNLMIHQIHDFDWQWTNVVLPLYEDPSLRWNPERKPEIAYETSMVYLDDNGNLLMGTGNYMTFVYTTESCWFSGDIDHFEVDSAYVDLDSIPGNHLKNDNPVPHMNTSDAFKWNYDAIRLTGYFEGVEFKLLKLSTYKYDELLSSFDTDAAILGQLDYEGDLDWEVHFDETAGADRKLVNLYAGGADLFYFTPSTDLPIRFDGKRYETLNDLLYQIGQEYRISNSYPESNESLWESYIIDVGTYFDQNYEHEYTYVTGIRCFPIMAAMQRLFGVYLITANVMALILLLFWVTLRKKFGNPVKRVFRHAGDNLAPLLLVDEPAWKEPYDLERGYAHLQQRIHTLAQENKQLQTALDYAQNAEIRRRELVSNITHELKTPLAIIHSYAEGLSAGIAKEKQEQYQNIILEESERMDSMVLEMLDLSRLEAGKIRLASDLFSLLDLTKQIFDKMALLVEEKGLTVHYDIAESFNVLADESRIGQVITNFVSNAIKYSPPGGNIRVKVYWHQMHAHFSIENESNPLPEEALERIWDSFYRTEASRTSKGTGLGLAIAKSIIELHRGSCTAVNTDSGVEFQFTLP